MKDLKGYWGKEDKKPGSPGWFVLVVSHLAILMVGLWLGHWMGEHFAQVSVQQKAIPRGTESERKGPSESNLNGKRGLPRGVPRNESTGEGMAASSDGREEEPEFTFYESLQKEKMPLDRRPIEAKEAKKRERTQGTDTHVRVMKGQPKPQDQKSTPRAYYVQVSSFRDEERARALAERLKKQGYPAEVVSKVVINRGIWHRVRMGPFRNESEANEKATAVMQSEKVAPLVMPEREGEGP
ncbi:MAG: hypothetical protein GTN74_11285 [Proteobacteria bacterium]|nr:hypothetical protein [Pseudomonadota bacterium]NIS70829.1 hypothetical protein [Pseudomonadota bacterium]